jgi:hypothetical protein
MTVVTSKEFAINEDTYFDLEQLKCLPVQSAISSLSIQLLIKYHLSHGLDFHDALIAATAIQIIYPECKGFCIYFGCKIVRYVIICNLEMNKKRDLMEPFNLCYMRSQEVNNKIY